jgi:transcription initiation factor TFIIB
MTELDRLTDHLHIPTQIKERAAVIYRKTLDIGLVQGRSIIAIVSAALYAACRAAEIPRTIKEVASVSGLKKKYIGRSYRLLLKELDIKMPIDDPTKEISKIASKVKISTIIQREALKIIQEPKKKGVITGKDPRGLTAATLYIACQSSKMNITQKELAMAADVTGVTLRNRYKSLKKALKLSI